MPVSEYIWFTKTSFGYMPIREFIGGYFKALVKYRRYYIEDAIGKG